MFCPSLHAALFFTLLFLFSSSSSILFYLHSFPTRRSSDLLTTRFVDVLIKLIELLRIDENASGKSRHDGLTPDFRARDRKSTRLNSSHLVISYAVFCLKKKKEYKQYQVLRYSKFVNDSNIH